VVIFVGGLAPGIYLLRIANSESERVLKVVKE
jgi:hypothetical protein